METKNLREAQVYDEAHLKKVTLFQEKGSTAFVINLMPGQSLPAHRHPGHQVFLMVFEGEGEYTVDGVTSPFSWRDVLNSGGEEGLSVKNTGRKLMSVYVVLTQET